MNRLKIEFVIWIGLMLGILQSAAPMAGGDALARMKIDRLEKVHADVVELQKNWQAVPVPGKYRDLRAILHLHSKFSHDSRGTIEEITAAAKSAGVSILMFTEHPAPHYDFVTDGHQGLRDGILLIPGAEATGFLAYPKASVKNLPSESPQEYANLVKRTEGLIFMCHLEERMNWEIAGLTGTEIYNVHADVKDEKKLIVALLSPTTLMSLMPALEKYPIETYAALQDYPADYLKRFDQLLRKQRLTGIAGNDAHQNTGLFLRKIDENKIRVEDPLGKKMLDLANTVFPPLAEKIKATKAGDIVFKLQLDPYPVALKYVSTHVLVKDLTQKDVWEALEAGRAYVAFDWMGDSTGFNFSALTEKGTTVEMGQSVSIAEKPTLTAKSTLPTKYRLIRVPTTDEPSKVVLEKEGREIDFQVKEPGHYRVECWLKLGGEDRPWILSNPIRVTAP